MYNLKANRHMYKVKAKPPKYRSLKVSKAYRKSNENSRFIVEEDLALVFSPGVTPNIYNGGGLMSFGHS
jgi:hypothetical protein